MYTQPLIIQWVFSDIHRWTRSATTIKHHSGLLLGPSSSPDILGRKDLPACQLQGASRQLGSDPGRRSAMRPWCGRSRQAMKFETRLGSRNGGIGLGSRKIVVQSKPLWCLNAARPKLPSFFRRHFYLYFLEKSSYKRNIVQLTSWQYIIIIWSGNGLAPSRLEPMMILGLITRFCFDKLITIGLGNDIRIYSPPSYPPEPINLMVN